MSYLCYLNTIIFMFISYPKNRKIKIHDKYEFEGNYHFNMNSYVWETYEILDGQICRQNNCTFDNHKALTSDEWSWYGDSNSSDS